MGDILDFDIPAHAEDLGGLGLPRLDPTGLALDEEADARNADIDLAALRVDLEVADGLGNADPDLGNLDARIGGSQDEEPLDPPEGGGPAGEELEGTADLHLDPHMAMVRSDGKEVGVGKSQDEAFGTLNIEL
jgi:hypothetical protein